MNKTHVIQAGSWKWRVCLCVCVWLPPQWTLHHGINLPAESDHSAEFRHSSSGFCHWLFLWGYKKSWMQNRGVYVCWVIWVWMVVLLCPSHTMDWWLVHGVTRLMPEASLSRSPDGWAVDNAWMDVCWGCLINCDGNLWPKCIRNIWLIGIHFWVCVCLCKLHTN